jgi:signal transduction histidine kinase
MFMTNRAQDSEGLEVVLEAQMPRGDATVIVYAVCVWVIGAVGLAVWRRRHPIWLTAVALTCGVTSAVLLSAFDWVLLVFALFAVGQRASAKAIWICGGAAVVLVGAALTLFTGLGARDGAVVEVALLCWLALLVSLFAQVGARRRYVAALIDSARHLAQERDQRAQIAVSQERERIAREMHDVVAHSVAVMVTLSDGAQAAVDKDPVRARAAMAQVSKTGRSAVSDMRRLLAILRSEPELEPQPGIEDLLALVNSFKESGLPVQLELAARTQPDQALGLAVYRIVQESLTNVLRHAPSTRWAKVAVREPAPGWREVTVENGPPRQGSAAPPWDGSGRGVIGMRQRAEVFGGKLEAGATPDGGWLVRATLEQEEGR